MKKLFIIIHIVTIIISIICTIAYLIESNSIESKLSLIVAMMASYNMIILISLDDLIKDKGNDREIIVEVQKKESDE